MPPLTTPPTDKVFEAKDFRLIGTDERYYSLDEIKKNNGFVVAFICNHCPYVKSIAKKISIEADSLAKIRVGFIAINPNDYDSYPEDSFENMKSFAQEHNFNFPYVIDTTQQVAEMYEAVCTPDFFGFNRKGILVYRGRLDDTGKDSTKKVSRRELYEAMSLTAQDKFIDFDIQPSIGCSIKWR